MSPAPTQQSPKMTTGRIDAVPCPHCGHPQDLRQIRDTGGLLEVGATASCDKCRRVYQVCLMQPVTIVKLRQSSGVRGDGGRGGHAMADGAPQASTVSLQQRRRR